MIAKLTGTLEAADEAAVIDVGGVGYLVFCSARTLARLPAAGGPVSFFVETHVREDHIHLYGFLDAAEREWFRLLTTVQGVGGRLALAILGALAPDDLAEAVGAGDRAMLTRANGVGPKLAQRIVSELKDKVGILPAPPGRAAAATPAGVLAADAVSALVNLGYRRAEALGAVAQAAQSLGAGAGIDVLIRAGLKELSS